jgi:prepilin signal peptidase PulO-like enzyme (type II secretory pathway)
VAEAVMLVIHVALGALVGLVAGEASRWLAAGEIRICRPDLLSLVLMVGASLALAVWLTADADGPTSAFRIALLLVLGMVLASDLRERAVYPALVYPAIGCLALAAPWSGLSITASVLGAVVAGALFAALYFIARLRYGAGAFGEGDISAAVLLGVVVGLPHLALALVLVALFGAGLALVAAARARSLHASFAYAPALSLAALATSLIHAR